MGLFQKPQFGVFPDRCVGRDQFFHDSRGLTGVRWSCPAIYLIFRSQFRVTAAFPVLSKSHTELLGIQTDLFHDGGLVPDLPFINHLSSITFHVSPFTFHLSPFTFTFTLTLTLTLNLKHKHKNIKISHFLKMVVKDGAKVIGACCGSTPDTISNIVKTLESN